MRFSKRCAVISLTFALTLGGVGFAAPALADPGTPTAPSWEDVAAARDDVAKSQAQAAAIQTTIQQLSDASDAADVATQQAAEKLQVARQKVTETQQRLDDLHARLEAAKSDDENARKALGSIIAQFARAGGGTGVSAALLSGGKTDGSDLLYELGTMEKLSSGQAALLDRAKQTSNLVTTLEDQTKAAQSENVTAQKEADAAFKTANDRANAAQAAVDNAQVESATLNAQLAFLQDRSASLDSAYAAAQAQAAALKAQAEQAARDRAAAEKAARDAAAAAAHPPVTTPPVTRPPATGGGHTGGGNSGGGNTTPPVTTPPVTTPPAGGGGGAPVGPAAAATSAVNFAYAQLGKWYVFAGEGPDVWDCSGLTMIAYRQAGINIGYHTVGAQYRQMTAVGRLVPRSSGLVPGDLLFYSQGGNTNSQTMYHMSIYVGNNQMIEAPEPGKKVQLVPVRTRNLVPNVGRPAG
ncbi:NlpC/P60 family protein [Mycetocola saprophilus]|uniref:C40 family peptidase n=1 Tax=Mycetocola saprophilus TaxID=76636 RepID=UPI0004BEDBDA|nr:C40 family peptidase [Mycetocola saprophilus]